MSTTTRQVNKDAVSFPLGRLLMTPSALQALARLQMTAIQLIARHAAGDWGDLGDADKQANDRALVEGSRILSAYTIQDVKFWVITEADRSATTVLLPSDY